MRVPHSWLTEVVNTGSPRWSVTPAELDAGFVRIGFEVEELVSLDQVTGPLVVGRVSSIRELEGFKKPIRYCLVDVGESEPRGIVCGARNFAVNDLIVAALPGAVLPGGFAIAARKTYGEMSDGMICSVSELGLGNDHSGILVLRPGSASPGDDAIEYLRLRDNVIELNVTPDRGYAFSVRGLARELANGFDVEYIDPATADIPGIPSDTLPGTSVTIDTDSGASRFVLRKVTGIDNTVVTPWWIARRLHIAGIRPISPAVDVTNYVMIELGHPLHSFDAERVEGDLTVRRARGGESITTLDGIQRNLDVEDVVICDESGPISLAGVMGGQSTEVGDATTDVLLEAAIWDPVAVFRTGKRHKLSSEAAKRYERGVDPALSLQAVNRAASLLAEIAGGMVTPELTDVGDVPAPPVITMPVREPDDVAGVTYAEGTAERRLKQIGCLVERVGDVLRVSPPTWRRDLTMAADLVEEVVRLEGLDEIPSIVPAAPAGRGLTRSQVRRRRISRALAHTGHVEVFGSPFMPAGVFDAWNLDADDVRRNVVSVLNPLEADRPYLATTLLPGLLEVLGRNVARGQRDLALYSIAQVSHPSAASQVVPALPVDRRPTDDELDMLYRSVPDQPTHVAAVYCGLRTPGGTWGNGRVADASDAFEAVREIGRTAQVDVELLRANYAPFHPGRCARVVVDDTVVGHSGELHPAVLERMGLPPRTCAFEINLELFPLGEYLPSPTVSPFPAVLQDVAVVVDEGYSAEEVRQALVCGAGDLLESIALFDVFAGEQLGAGKKSLAYALRFRAIDRTLTEDEASAARDAAVAEAHRRCGAVIRG